MKLAALGEAGLLHLLTGRWPRRTARVSVGVGDDCAVLRGHGKDHSWLFKTDAVVEGVHFLPATPARLIGRKALARALSDIAAMGGRPVAAVVSIGVPLSEEPRRLLSIYAGLEALAKKYDTVLAGGETTRCSQLWLNVALLGECTGHAPILRSGAHPGDQLFVTGRLGGSRARRHLHFAPRLAEGQWLARHAFATAMMDLSDGLGADLPRLAAASRLGFQLDEASLPRAQGATLSAALNDGEDYELLFTVPAAKASRLKKMWPFPTPLHCIGQAVAKKNAPRRPRKSAHGFDHFKQR